MLHQMPHRKVQFIQIKAVRLKGFHRFRLLLNHKRRLTREVLAKHPISHRLLPHRNIREYMGIMLILLVLHSCLQYRLRQEHRTAIPLLNLLHNHRRASDLRTAEDRAVGADMDMFHQYMDKDQGTTTELERYNNSSRR